MTDITRLSTEMRTRWRVALLGSSSESRTVLKAAVAQAGGRVVVEAPLRADSLTIVAHAGADVLILQPGREGGHPDLLPFTSAGRPVVLLTRDPSRALLKVATRSGVAAVLVEPLPPAQVAPTLDLAVARFGDSEVLRRKLAERKLIERAKGRLMAVASMSEEQAFRWLRTRAMDTRSRLADTARAVLDNRSPAALPIGAVDRLDGVRPHPSRRPHPTSLEHRHP